MQTDYKNKGLNLLKKGQKGIIHAIFSRFGLALVMLVLQVLILLVYFRGLRNICPIFSAAWCFCLLFWSLSF